MIAVNSKGYIVDGKRVPRDEYRQMIEDDKIKEHNPSYAYGLTAKERKEDLILFEAHQRAKKEKEEKDVDAKEKAAADKAENEAKIKAAEGDVAEAKDMLVRQKVDYEAAVGLFRVNPAAKALLEMAEKEYITAIKAFYDMEAKYKTLLHPELGERIKAQALLHTELAIADFKRGNPDPASTVPAASSISGEKYSIIEGTDINGNKFKCVLTDEKAPLNDGMPATITLEDARRDISRKRATKDDFKWRRIVKMLGDEITEIGDVDGNFKG